MLKKIYIDAHSHSVLERDAVVLPAYSFQVAVDNFSYLTDLNTASAALL